MYKSVIIIGPQASATYKKLTMNINNSDALFVGNGKLPLLSELFLPLQDKIDRDTRIDIFMHSVEPESKDGTSLVLHTLDKQIWRNFYWIIWRMLNYPTRVGALLM